MLIRTADEGAWSAETEEAMEPIAVLYVGTIVVLAAVPIIATIAPPAIQIITRRFF